MTLIAGCNLGQYAVIAADTRTSYYSAYSKLFDRDGDEKIHPTALGVMTGTGFIPLLNAVKDRVAEVNAVGNTDDIIRIIKEERANLSPDLLARDSHVAESVINYTSWIFTYIGVGVSGLGEEFKGAGIRLALAHPQNDYTLGLYGPNHGVIAFPSGVDTELMASLQTHLDARIEPLADFSKFKENVVHHVALLASIIAEVAKVNDDVSSSFQYAVHAYGAEPLISHKVGLPSPARGDPSRVLVSRVWESVECRGPGHLPNATTTKASDVEARFDLRQVRRRMDLRAAPPASVAARRLRQSRNALRCAVVSLPQRVPSSVKENWPRMSTLPPAGRHDGGRRARER